MDFSLIYPNSSIDAKILWISWLFARFTGAIFISFPTSFLGHSLDKLLIRCNIALFKAGGILYG
ncbi:hypothetical protein AS888_07600 [Peribacillus simplex]|uniref:Uncharacterized protein n=1 Tax=Peribacillus simplex TaxID=1478 RepID=A0A109MUZ1_9BACI|nr:hypothetical protein AS888_07600 [Peribacillus simplex]